LIWSTTAAAEGTSDTQRSARGENMIGKRETTMLGDLKTLKSHLTKPTPTILLKVTLHYLKPHFSRTYIHNHVTAKLKPKLQKCKTELWN